MLNIYAISVIPEVQGWGWLADIVLPAAITALALPFFQMCKLRLRESKRIICGPPASGKFSSLEGHLGVPKEESWAPACPLPHAAYS